MEAAKKTNIKQLIITVYIVNCLNFAGNYYFKRFDLTHDKRYTLSQTTLKIIKDV